MAVNIMVEVKLVASPAAASIANSQGCAARFSAPGGKYSTCGGGELLELNTQGVRCTQSQVKRGLQLDGCQ